MQDTSGLLEPNSTEESIQDFVQRHTKEARTTLKTMLKELKLDRPLLRPVKEDQSWREERGWEDANDIYERTDRHRTARDSNLRGLLFLAVVALLAFLFTSFCLALYKSKRQYRYTSSSFTNTRSAPPIPVQASVTNGPMAELQPSLLNAQNSVPECPAETCSTPVSPTQSTPAVVTTDNVNLLNNIECTAIRLEQPSAPRN